MERNPYIILKKGRNLYPSPPTPGATWTLPVKWYCWATCLWNLSRDINCHWTISNKLSSFILIWRNVMHVIKLQSISVTSFAFPMFHWPFKCPCLANIVIRKWSAFVTRTVLISLQLVSRSVCKDWGMVTRGEGVFPPRDLTVGIVSHPNLIKLHQSNSA